MDTTRPSLLLRLRDRSDAAAWQMFDAIYRPMLYRFACVCGLGHADAEDVTQHCLSQICTQIGAFEYDPTRGRFKSWLRTLVNNRIRNLARSRREQPQGSALPEPASVEEEGPDAAFERVWMQEHLWYCLRGVQAEVDSTTYRAFLGYVVNGQPIEEVCRELNLSPNNIYTIKWRLTRKIAERMQELTGDPAG